MILHATPGFPVDAATKQDENGARLMLEVAGLGAAYGRVEVLRDVNLQVQAGEIVTLIGANGAGKTTLLRCISGLLPPRQGRVILDGQDITGVATERMAGLGMGSVPERRQLFGSLSVLENLELGAYHRYGKESRKIIAADLDAILGLFPVLKNRRFQMAGTLSGGEQQMVALGRGLMARPKLLLLDEPTLGLAPVIVNEIIRVIGDLRDRGVTVLLVEQNTKAALALADRGYVMETGRIVGQGSAVELLGDESLRVAYLGRGRQPRA